MKSKNKDILLCIVYFGLMIAFIIYYCIKSGFDIGSIFVQLTLCIMALVGFLNYCIYEKWDIFVPNFFLERKKEEQNESINQYIESYFTQDILYVKTHDEIRIDYLLSQLGISHKDLEQLTLELIKLRAMPFNTIDDAKRRLDYLLSRKHVIIDLRKIPAEDRAYTEVCYYINFVNLMHEKNHSEILSSIFKRFLIEEVGNNFDKIAVPYDSNFLLGFEISKLMNKPLITLREKSGRTNNKRPWDGTVHKKDRVIIIHDVFVSGEQIENAIITLKDNCDILGVYCLINRKEYETADSDNYRDSIAQLKIPVKYLTEISDEKIEVLMCNK